MKILHKPKATVGRIIKDLEPIVAKVPKIFLDFSNDDGNDMFVEGVKLRKGIAIFELTGKKNRAATVEDILEMLRHIDGSLGVVMQNGWELQDFEQNEDGSIIRYDDEDGYCLFYLDRDVRLVTTQQMEKEIENRHLDKYPDCKLLAVLEETKTAYPMNCVTWQYGKMCLCYSTDCDSDSITLGSFMEEFPTCVSFMLQIRGKYHTVEVGEKGIFFGIEKGGEKYICFRIGEVVYDPREDW